MDYIILFINIINITSFCGKLFLLLIWVLFSFLSVFYFIFIHCSISSYQFFWFVKYLNINHSYYLQCYQFMITLNFTYKKKYVQFWMHNNILLEYFFIGLSRLWVNCWGSWFLLNFSIMLKFIWFDFWKELYEVPPMNIFLNYTRIMIYVWCTSEQWLHH